MTPYDLSLHYEVETAFRRNFDGGGWLIEATLTFTSETDEEIVVGHLSGIGARQDDFFEACDSTAQEYCDVASALLQDRDDETGHQVMIYLTDMFVEPEHRGLKAGYFFMREVVDCLRLLSVANGTTIYIVPGPTIRRGEPEISDKDLETGRRKLLRYWERFGFSPTGSSIGPTLHILEHNLDYKFPARSWMRKAA